MGRIGPVPKTAKMELTVPQLGKLCRRFFVLSLVRVWRSSSYSGLANLRVRRCKLQRRNPYREGSYGQSQGFGEGAVSCGAVSGLPNISKDASSSITDRRDFWRYQ